MNHPTLVRFANQFATKLRAVCALLQTAIDSYRNLEGIRCDWNRLTVFNTVRDHAQSERFYFLDRLVTRSSIHEYARKITYFGNPAPICFSVYINVQCHALVTSLTCMIITGKLHGRQI